VKNQGCFLILTLLLVFGFGTAMVAAVEALFSESMSQSVRSTIGGTLMGVLMIVGLGWLLYADSVRRRKALRTQPQADVDERGAVLYLRSFLSDAKSPQLLGKPGNSFEEDLVTILARVGPVIAVGEPDEELPPLGATRKYFAGDWHGEVQRLIRSASVVVLRAGLTPGLRWEVESVVHSLWPQRVLLALPDGRDADDQYRAFARELGTMFPRSLPAERERASWIMFEDDWTPRPIAIARWKWILGQHSRSRAGRIESLRPFCERLGVLLERGTTTWTALGSVFGPILVALLFAAVLADEGVRHDWHLQFRDSKIVSERRTFAVVVPGRWDRMPEPLAVEISAASDRVTVRKLKPGLDGYVLLAVIERIPAMDVRTFQETARNLLVRRGARIMHEEPGRMDAIEGEIHHLVLIIRRRNDVFCVHQYGRPELARTQQEDELKQIVASLQLSS
jgi:hypothetical protein